MRFASRTDKGARRSSNEDAYLATGRLFAVADGMGGHLAGEVASALAIDALKQLDEARGSERALVARFRRANEEIFSRAMADAERRGMGTTLTACLVEGRKLVVAHVGDSRLYRLRSGRIKLLTKDHSLVAQMVERGHLTPEEAADHPQRSVITRALGAESDVRIDHRVREMLPGDRYLLATDGLTIVVGDDEIASIMAGDDDLEDMARELIDLAISRGAPDNVTVVMFEPESLPAAKRPRRVLRRLSVIVVVAGVLSAAAWATKSYLSSGYFLGSEQGKVAVFKGVPGSFAGLEVRQLVEKTEVDVDKLPKPYRDRLNRGMAVKNLGEAEKTIKDYEALMKEGRR
ncbi:MAG: Stp1/IreP family PP2C-type Ser/Thr phosphatase [Candidatus Aquicultorales bacterium]